MKELINTFLLGLLGLTTLAQWNPDTFENLEIASVADQQAMSTSDGKTWIAYYSPNEGNYDMRAQLLDSEGNKLLGPDGVLVNGHPSGSATYVFNICLNQKGDLIIAAQDERSGNGTAAVIYNINQNGTSEWNGADGVVLGDGLSPYPAVLANGDVIVAWNDNDNKLSMQKINETGAVAWTNPKQFNFGSRVSRGQLVPNGEDGYVMVFQKGSFGISTTLCAQRFDNDGEAVWAEPLEISDETTSAARYYSVKHDADTTYVGYYSSSLSNHFNSWIQRIDPDGSLPYGINGAAFSDYSSIGDPEEQDTEIAFNDNSPYIWAVSSFSNPGQTEYGVFVQKINKADGVRMLNPFGKEVYPITAERFAQRGALALKGEQPVFMVCSDVDYLIKGTILDEEGNFLLPDQDMELSSTLIQQPSALNKGRFAFTENVAGQSVALWAETRSSTQKLYAQNFDLSILDTSVTVSTHNDAAPQIAEQGGTLQMEAAINPAAANQEVIWSIIPGTGTASISATGLVTAETNGTVWAKATSVISSSYADSLEINIINNTGINAVAQKIGYSAYPNPASEAVYVNIKENHPPLTITISDIQGKTLRTIKTKANELHNPLKIEMNHLSRGIYLLDISGKDLHLTDKIVK